MCKGKLISEFGLEILIAVILGFLGVLATFIFHHFFSKDIQLIIAYAISYEVIVITGTTIIAFTKYTKNEKKRTLPFETHLEMLRQINMVNNVELKHYVLNNLITSEIKKYHSFVSGAEITCPYSVQIQIADGISTGTYNYFWATSMDSPSILYREGSHYFNSLEKLRIIGNNGTIPTKSRIVLKDIESLYNDYETDRTGFQEFINWHNKNGWGLRFYLKSVGDIENDFKKFINEEEPIKDFLITDKNWVYGRIKGDQNYVRIKMIQDHEIKFKAYHHFFETLWKNASDSEIITSKIIRKMEEKTLISAYISDYKDFVGLEKGQEFFSKVCHRIENASSEIIALDIADLKQAVAVWKTNIAYQQFLTACTNAANNQKKVTRIFILNDFECLKISSVKDIIIEQLNSNINIGLIDSKECKTNQLSPKDYIIVDNNFGFKLEDEQSFDIGFLSLTNNLILKLRIKQYKDEFNKFLDSVKGSDHFFEGINGKEKFGNFIKYLKTTI